MFSTSNNYHQNQYNKLMSFIRLNKNIPEFVDSIDKNEDHLEKILLLENAIKKGLPFGFIFENPNCLGFLLYLIKHNRITENQANTVLIYLMALKSENFQTEVFDIQYDKIILSKFIDGVDEYAEKIGLTLDKKDILKIIQNYKGVDSWFITITPSTNLEKDEKEFLDEIMANTLCLKLIDNKYIIPSVEIIYCLFKQLNLDPIQLYSIFGILNVNTVSKLHAAGFHPLSIDGYPLVKNNLKEAHNRPLSPIVILLHDIYHAYSGTLISKKEHNYLFHKLIPFLDNLFIEDISIEKKSNEVIDCLQQLLFRLNDMDLGTSINKNNSHEFFEWWLNNIGQYMYYIPNQTSGNLQNLIKFYFKLFTTMNSNLNEDIHYNQLVIKAFGTINQTIYNRVNDFITIHQGKDFPIGFDIKIIEDFFEQQQTSGNLNYAHQCFNLLNECETIEQFGIKLLAKENSKLYNQLVKANFFYLPEMLNITNQDLHLIKSTLQTKLHAISSANDNTYMNRFFSLNKECINYIGNMITSYTHYKFRK